MAKRNLVNTASEASAAAGDKLNRNSNIINDFSKVGGLGHHLETLRDIIIFPLLHGNIYSHFNIKIPRGVLFYGPPGTILTNFDFLLTQKTKRYRKNVGGWSTRRRIEQNK